jgi:hypothetical protein
MPSCAYCSGPLEQGSLRAVSGYPVSVTWVPTVRGRTLDGLTAVGLLGSVVFPGFRCLSCETFLIYYQSISKSQGPQAAVMSSDPEAHD